MSLASLRRFWLAADTTYGSAEMLNWLQQPAFFNGIGEERTSTIAPQAASGPLAC